MARQGRKALADMRAMEEQEERVNPIRGRGATPSMGLSQFRGGDRMVGAGFLSDLTSGRMAKQAQSAARTAVQSGISAAMADPAKTLEGLNAARKMLGMGKQGCGTRKGQTRKTARKAYEPSEAHEMGRSLGQHLQSLHGKGFFDDFKQGFNAVVSPIASIAKTALPVLAPGYGTLASAGLDMLGYGRGDLGDDDLEGGMRTGRYEGKGELTIHHGGGFLSDLISNVPLVGGPASAITGMFGLGKHGKKTRKPAGPSDGRRRRAAIVKKVMAEQGLSMIDASKYVKAHGLY